VKDVGIVGVPYSGKSTLFTALTRSGSAGGRANQAVVEVPDPRLPVLADLERKERAVHARMRFVDVPGGLTAQGLGEFRTMDALCVVVRAFGSDAAPAAELEQVASELLIADLAAIESGLERARKRARGQKDPGAEVAVLERAHAALDDGRPLRDAGLSAEDRVALRGYGPLTLKPAVVVANVEEDAGLPDGLPRGTLAISAALEAEVAGMDPHEAGELLHEFGIEEPGLDRVIHASYDALDLITFLTIGDEETRAWEVPRGATAPEAAGVIHSDLERGFIRAEVVTFDEVVDAGGWDAARARGLMRVEGKDYEVREGDVLHVRFAV
jgi:ribosome-binding ATPase YchF (GTP1/OBG family)